jgi:hypothetical protein
MIVNEFGGLDNLAAKLFTGLKVSFQNSSSVWEAAES